MKKEKEVSDEVAKDLAKSLDAIFKTISAKDPDGINNLFIEIGEKLLSKRNQGDSEKVVDYKITQQNMINEEEIPEEKKSECCDCFH